jgi:phage baseplate assembly protein W|tara:strand:- start:798 stop:1238 length:441 start_codon:yes stop_codon:yes gene_type:complete
MPIFDRRKDRFIEDQDTRVSVGIDFPFGRVPNSSDGYFKTSKTTIDAIKNNIKLLLKTERSERLFQPFLGMNLKRFVFEQITEDTKIQIENDIVDTFETWLPFVELRDIEVITNSITEDRNKININIVFNIKKAPNSLESVGVVLE